MSREALRVHVVTLLIFSVAAGAIALVVSFPRLFLFVGLVAASAFAYLRLHDWVEARSKELQGPTAEPAPAPVEEIPRPKRRRKAKLAELEDPRPAGTGSAPAADLTAPIVRAVPKR